MARYRIEVTLPKGGNVKTVQAALKKPGVLPKGAEATVTKDDPPMSRADRLSAAEATFEDAKSEVEALKEELEQWKEALPENLQDGTKAQEIDDAVSELESLVEALESCDFSTVSFPGMY